MGGGAETPEEEESLRRTGRGTYWRQAGGLLECVWKPRRSGWLYGRAVQCESGYELLGAHYSQLARGKGTFFSFNPVFL